MPIYEYRCGDCRKRYSVLTLRVSEVVEPICEHCGSAKGERLLSRFAMPKSDAERAARMDDASSLSGLDENDPKSMARWMKRVGKEMGDEVADADFEEMIDTIESGGDDSGEGGDE